MGVCVCIGARRLAKVVDKVVFVPFVVAGGGGGAVAAEVVEKEEEEEEEDEDEDEDEEREEGNNGLARTWAISDATTIPTLTMSLESARALEAA